MRRLVFNLLFFPLFLTVFSVSASAETVLFLYSDTSRLGAVSSMKKGSHVMVSAGEMSKLLGFTLTEKEDTLVITAGKNKLQLVADAAAAWLDAELVPLAASTMQQKNVWFVESRSALKLFNGLLSRSGKQSSLRWETEENNVSEQSYPQASSSTTLPALTPGPTLSASSVINGIRWGIDDDKIRAVLDYEGQKIPDIKQELRTVKVTFSVGKGTTPEFASPYDEVKVSSVNFGDRLVLEFSSTLPLQEVIVLEAPPRIVIDYKRKTATVVAKTQSTTSVSPPPPTPFPTQLRESSRKGPKRVTIDPGHGGNDPGAVANGVREKDVNLAVAHLLGGRLKKSGYDVRLTRSTDVYLTLQQRTDLANKWNSDVFVSIHANALPPGRHALGMEIYIMALPTDKDAMQLALLENREVAEGGNGESVKAADKKTRMLLSILGNMQQNAKISESTGFAENLFNSGKEGGIKMRRVAQAPFFVLRGAAMPAVLVETGFLTEKSEARMLGDKKYQEKMANALAKGIVGYLENN